MGGTGGKGETGVTLQLYGVTHQVNNVGVQDVVHSKVEVDLLSQLPAIKVTAVAAAIDVVMVSKKIVHNLRKIQEGLCEEDGQTAYMASSPFLCRQKPQGEACTDADKTSHKETSQQDVYWF